MVLQSIFTLHGEHVKICLAAEGFGTRLCRLEPISNCKVTSSEDVQRKRSSLGGVKSKSEPV